MGPKPPQKAPFYTYRVVSGQPLTLAGCKETMSRVQYTKHNDLRFQL